MEAQGSHIAEAWLGEFWALLYNHWKLANLITRTTSLSNSMKLSHAMWGHQRRMGHDGEVWQNVVRRRRECKPLQYSCLENPMNSMKRQKVRTLKDELPRSIDAQLLLEISADITPERMKRRNQSKNNTQLWIWLLMEVKPDAVKNNTA